jgi:hypothetical protein
MAQEKSTSSKNTSQAAQQDAQAAEPKTKQRAAPAGDVGEQEVHDKFDKINEQGYVGTAADPTPNENYTLAGVTSGAPTPETDAEAAAEAEAFSTQDQDQAATTPKKDGDK